MNLVFLAKQDKLPNFQSMDDETLCWIKQNKPDFQADFKKNFIPLIIEDVLRFTPRMSFFLKKETVNSIHGMRHIMRVIASVSYMTRENKIIGQSVAVNALIAASLHDLRRLSDKGDEGHAQRAVNWFFSQIKELSQFFRFNLEKNLKDISRGNCSKNHRIKILEGKK